MGKFLFSIDKKIDKHRSITKLTCYIVFNVAIFSLILTINGNKLVLNSKIRLGILILIIALINHLIIYIMNRFNKYKVYEQGISDNLYTITWMEVVAYNIKDRDIILKCNYRLIGLSFNININLKLKNEFIELLKKNQCSDF